MKMARGGKIIYWWNPCNVYSWTIYHTTIQLTFKMDLCVQIMNFFIFMCSRTDHKTYIIFFHKSQYWFFKVLEILKLIFKKIQRIAQHWLKPIMVNSKIM
jgi:hypothetical protein